jgi:hypothetical protein
LPFLKIRIFLQRTIDRAGGKSREVICPSGRQDECATCFEIVIASERAGA